MALALDDIQTGSGEKTPVFVFADVGHKVALTVQSAAVVEVDSFNNPGVKEKKLVVTGSVIRAKGQRTQLDEDGNKVVTMERGKKVDVLMDAEAGDIVTVWLKSTGSQAGAVKAAYQAVGAPGIEEGAELTIELAEYRDIGKASPMKVFTATYKSPPKPAVALDENPDNW